MSTDRSATIGAFFEDKWHIYQKAIRRDVLCHTEMLAVLDRLLTVQFGNRAFTFADFGCGDGSAVLDTLLNKTIAHYIGIDAAQDLVANAASVLAPLNCRKTLICQDMATAVNELTVPVDVMYCSYSLHHLPPDQKVEFVQNCYQRLSSPGYLMVVDGVLSETETRDQWLQRLDSRFQEKVPDLTAEDRERFMQHPRESDHPETIAAFRRMAEQSPWRNFDVLVDRDDFLAFMVFEK